MASDPVIEIKKLIKERGVVVDKIKMPSYISVFCNSENDIILIHKEVRKKTFILEEAHNDTYISEFDVTGQPLEAPFSSLSLLDITSTMAEIPEDQIIKESNHAPVPLNDARCYLSRCNLSVKSNLPVWVYCDGNGDSRIVLLGSEQSRLTSGDGVWIKRSWAVEEDKSSRTPTSGDSPTLQEYCQIHYRLSQLPETRMQCELSCTYLVKKIMSTSNPSLIYTSTALKLCWNKLSPLPPLHGATETSLVTKCGIGRGSGGLHFVWSQLCLLQKYLDIVVGLRETKDLRSNIALPSNEFAADYIKSHCTNDDKVSTMSGKLENLLHDVMYSYSVGPVARGECLTIRELVETSTLPSRPALDLTDKLWHLFIEYKTNQELYSCLYQLLEAKRNTNSKPFIRTTNISRLAQAMLGEAGAGIIDPLEFLVEIGIEKLKEELLSIFSKSQVVTISKLKMPPLPKFNSVPSSGWCDTVNVWLKWLCQTYCCLEMLVNAQESLGLTNIQVVGFASSVVEQIMSDQSQITGVPFLIENPLQKVAVQIPIQLVDGHISEYSTHWNLKLTSESDIRRVTSIFYRGLQSPFPCNVVEDDLELESKAPHSGTCLNYYYCAQLHSVADKFNI